MTPPPLDLAAIRALCDAATPETIEALRNCVRFYVDRWYMNRDGGPAEPDKSSPTWRAIDLLTHVPQLLAAVEQLQRERDDARAERDELIEAVIGGPQAKLVELTDLTAAERTAEAIAAWLDGDGTSTRSSALARMIRSGEWKENR